jgi:hypothetical protein
LLGGIKKRESAKKNDDIQIFAPPQLFIENRGFAWWHLKGYLLLRSSIRALIFYFVPLEEKKKREKMKKPSATLLVIESTSIFDWAEVFHGAKLENGRGVEVFQGTWEDLSITSFPDPKGCQVTIRSKDAPPQSIKPDHILMRSDTRGTWGQDSSNKLFALMHAGIEATNSLLSCYSCLEKPVVWSELRRLARKLGADTFPLVSQTFYPSYREMIIPPEMPCVGKTGSAHAGKGKILIRSEEVFEDYASLVAVQPYFSTVEEYIDWDWDGRIQKIGSHLRVWKRQVSRIYLNLVFFISLILQLIRHLRGKETRALGKSLKRWK